MTIRSGYGLHWLNLSMTGEDLIHSFGAPAAKKRQGTFREYWLYPDLGFDCIVSRRTDHVLSIFLNSERTPLEQEFFGQTEAQIRLAYGPPSLSGGGIPDGADGLLNVWYSYDSGIGFSFDSNRRVKTVMIFSPKRKVKSKAAAEHTTQPRHKVAAFALRTSPGQTRDARIAEFNRELERRLESFDRGETIDPKTVRERIEAKSKVRRKMGA